MTGLAIQYYCFISRNRTKNNIVFAKGKKHCILLESSIVLKDKFWEMLLNEMLQNEAALKWHYFVTFATLKRYSV